MRSLNRFAIKLVAIFTLILFLLLALRPPMSPLAARLPPDILPGQHLDPKVEHLRCREEYPSTPTGSCALRIPDLIFLSYDPATYRIYRVYYRLPKEISLGTLVALWGVPKGVLRSNYFQYVVWSEHRMVFATLPADMTRGSIYLVYDEDERGMTPWKGFQSR